MVSTLMNAVHRPDLAYCDPLNKGVWLSGTESTRDPAGAEWQVGSTSRRCALLGIHLRGVVAPGRPDQQGPRRPDRLGEGSRGPRTVTRGLHPAHHSATTGCVGERNLSPTGVQGAELITSCATQIQQSYVQFNKWQQTRPWPLLPPDGASQHRHGPIPDGVVGQRSTDETQWRVPRAHRSLPLTASGSADAAIRPNQRRARTVMSLSPPVI